MFYIKNKLNNTYLYTKDKEKPTTSPCPFYGYNTKEEAEIAIINMRSWYYQNVILVYPDNTEVEYLKGVVKVDKPVITSTIKNLAYNDIKIF